VLARIGTTEITLDEYKQHLFELSGLSALEDLVYLRLLQSEAGRLGVTVEQAELDTAWEEERRSMITRARGDERIMLDTLVELGFTETTYRQRFEFAAGPALLEAKLVRASRVVDEADVQALFEQRYGVGGDQVTVRHLLISFTRTRTDLKQSGWTEEQLTREAVEAAMATRMAELAQRAGAGDDLESLARAYSHDISVHQNGGLIQGYNYKHYGPELAEAVRAAEVGVTSGPIQTQAGLHLVRVEERRVTDLEDVRSGLVAELTAAEASFAERGELKLRLFREGDVRAPGVVGSRLLEASRTEGR
jgi:parvulin-like peptidyl-prolyl isomerase